MYLMIDNYDSYVYNLVAYMKELNMDVSTMRDDKICWEKVKLDIEQGNVKGVIISPGPKHPKDFSYIHTLLQLTGVQVPVLGVCLGHQMIADAFGAKVVKGRRPMHGKISEIIHKRECLFEGIPTPMKVTRYHSLIVSEEAFPDELCIDAKSRDGVIMGIHHRKRPIYGIQFHPEAVLTEYGYELLKNYKRICEQQER